MARQFRIGFDARLAGQKHAGIGRYSEELLRALIQESGRTVQWVVFTFDSEQLPWLERYSNIERKVVPIRHYTVKEQLLLGQIFANEQVDLLHVPHFNVPLLYPGKFVVTIHDLLWHRQRDAHATTLSPFMYRVKVEAYKYVTQRAIRRAVTVFVPSKEVAHEISALIPYHAPVIVTNEGINQVYLRAEEVGKRKRGSRKKERAPYCVYTGSLYPHKNVERVLLALQGLPDFRLKLVSSRNVFTDDVLQRAESLGVSEQVDWMGYQSDEDLVELYRESVALIQPSLSEGFGLTGLEAMAVGCPVVASDSEIFHEIYQDNVQYFDPNSTEELIRVLQKLVHEPPSISFLQAAQRHAKSFTWEKTAKIVWKKYQVILNHA